MKYIAILFIKFYKKLISPFLPPACRFVPSCSEYAMLSYEIHGFMLGSYYSAKRICRCHPGNPGGLDPVPEKKWKADK